MYSRFILKTDARELHALLGIAGGIAGKIARGLVVAVWMAARARAAKVWIELHEDADRGARGWS